MERTKEWAEDWGHVKVKQGNNLTVCELIVMISTYKIDI